MHELVLLIVLMAPAPADLVVSGGAVQVSGGALEMNYTAPAGAEDATDCSVEGPSARSGYFYANELGTTDTQDGDACNIAGPTGFSPDATVALAGDPNGGS